MLDLSVETRRCAVERKRKWIVGSILGVALVAGGATGVAVAASSDDTDVPVTGAELERASAAALAHTGGGRVTDSEAGDEEGAYEIEVTFDDGRQVDVHLDEGFRVISEVADVEDGPEDG